MLEIVLLVKREPKEIFKVRNYIKQSRGTVYLTKSAEHPIQEVHKGKLKLLPSCHANIDQYLK